MVHSLSLEMEVDPKKTVPPAPLETSMLFGDVMVSFDTEDSGSSYSFSPATAAIAIEKPVIEKKNRKERGGRGGGDRRDKKSPPDSIVSVAETALAFAPVVVPTSMKHPDLYAAVAPQVPDTAAAASAPRSERERPRPRKDGDKAGSLDNSNNSMPLKAVATDNLKRCGLFILTIQFLHSYDCPHLSGTVEIQMRVETRSLRPRVETRSLRLRVEIRNLQPSRKAGAYWTTERMNIGRSNGFWNNGFWRDLRGKLAMASRLRRTETSRSLLRKAARKMRRGLLERSRSLRRGLSRRHSRRPSLSWLRRL